MPISHAALLRLLVTDRRLQLAALLLALLNGVPIFLHLLRYYCLWHKIDAGWLLSEIWILDTPLGVGALINDAQTLTLVALLILLGLRSGHRLYFALAGVFAATVATSLTAVDHVIAYQLATVLDLPHAALRWLADALIAGSFFAMIAVTYPRLDAGHRLIARLMVALLLVLGFCATVGDQLHNRFARAVGLKGRLVLQLTEQGGEMVPAAAALLLALAALCCLPLVRRTAVASS